MLIEAIFYNGLLCCILMSFLVIQPSPRLNQVIEVPDRIWGLLICFFVVICLANVPIPWSLGGADRTRYANDVISAAGVNTSFKWGIKDALFYFYIYLCAKIMNYQVWFYLTAFIYVGNYYLTAYRLSKDYTYVLILMMLCNFQFFGYGQNTIRAGLAASFVILGLSFFKKPLLMLLFCMVGYFIHSSMIIPISAMACAFVFRKSKVYVALWLMIIVYSYLGNSGIEKMFAGLTDETHAGYLLVDAAKTRYKVGFRWDFLLYSTLPVIIGYIYIYKLKFESAFYSFIYNTYLVANSFWILVIRANFTDRFAYLSWFLFPLLLFYPLVTKQLFWNVREQRSKLFLIMCIVFGFNYFMYWKYK